MKKILILSVLIIGLVFFFWPGYPPNQFLQKFISQTPLQQLAPSKNALKAHKTPDLVSLEIDPTVDSEDADKLHEGIRVMDFYLNEWFGHSIDKKVLMTVDASTKNSLIVEENGQMVALLHTNEPLWQQFRQFIVQYRMDMRSRFAAHEYVHYYQRDAGCGRIYLPQENTLKWLMEGEAEWLSYTALNKAGQLPFYTGLEQILQIQYQQNQGNLKPLSAYEKEATADVVSSYSYFALALELLMKNRDIKTLDDFCTNVKKGQGVSAAFQNAFGISLEKFYSDFEAYRQNLIK